MICEAFGVLAELILAQGVRDLHMQPGVYELAIDSRWKVAVNAHREPEAWGGAEIPPYSAAIEYNGWPAGLIDQHGGIIAAGECANENTFIEAMQARLAADGKASEQEGGR